MDSLRIAFHIGLMNFRVAGCLVPMFFLLPGCEKPAPSAAATEAVSLDDWFASTPPADARPIHLVRQSVSPGDTVVLSGIVMGREKPFVEGRAAFVLGDPEKITSCDKMGDKDHCPTPWDACCSTPEAKREGTATIQIVENGRVLKQSVKGAHGLKELSAVTLTGTVDKASTPEALIVNATSIHVSN